MAHNESLHLMTSFWGETEPIVNLLYGGQVLRRSQSDIIRLRFQWTRRPARLVHKSSHFFFLVKENTLF